MSARPLGRVTGRLTPDMVSRFGGRTDRRSYPCEYRCEKPLPTPAYYPTRAALQLTIPLSGGTWRDCAAASSANGCRGFLDSAGRRLYRPTFPVARASGAGLVDPPTIELNHPAN